MSLTLATAESYRAAGVLLAMAAGDALGAGHELITPHVANPPDAALIERVTENVRRFVVGEPLLGVIDPRAGF